MSQCKYTAQGDYICKEGFVNNTCYGAYGTVCYSCQDVVNAYRNNRWAYNTNAFEQCTTKPNGNAQGTLGSYGKSCYNCSFSRNNLRCESCLDNYGGWRDPTILDTTNCSKGSIYNNNGKLQCT